MTHGPGADEFGRLAAEHGVVPVWREVLADLETPLSVYAKLAGRGPSFLLESAEHGERWGRYSFVGLDPFLVLRGKDGEVEWDGDPPSAARDARGPLDALHLATHALRAPLVADLPPLHGGAVGYIGWDAVREIERVPASGTDDLGVPDVLMLFPRHIVGFDHLRQTVTVVTNVVIGDDPAGQYDEAIATTDAIVDRLGDATPRGATDPPRPRPVDGVSSNVEPGVYESMVERALEYIAAGDVFQVVPSQRFALETAVDPFTIYRMLRVINPSPYLFLFDFGGLHVIGSSPEALVRVAGTHAETWPIAGTRPRGRTAEEDRQLERDLLDSEKERAEHVMLVDLGRNDLGRVCETGSVSVDDLMTVERYSHVMHLVSRVSGTLREDVAPVDVLRATFPAGTVSGAPKVRAMEIIDELEPTRRGVYAGAVGYVDLSGNLDTCIALRTLVVRDGIAYAQAGAGIVADSSPTDEETETRNKAMALLSAVAAASMVSNGGSEFRDFDVSRRVPSSRVRRTAPSSEEGTVGQKKSTGRKAASKKAAPTKKSSTKKAAKRPAKKATKRAAKKSTKRSAKKAAKKSARPAKKAAKKSAKKAAKRPAKKATKRPAKKTSKRAAKKATKKATKKRS